MAVGSIPVVRQYSDWEQWPVVRANTNQYISVRISPSNGRLDDVRLPAFRGSTTVYGPILDPSQPSNPANLESIPTKGSLIA